jgi:hypothetical protein
MGVVNCVIKQRRQRVPVCVSRSINSRAVAINQRVSEYRLVTGVVNVRRGSPVVTARSFVNRYHKTFMMRIPTARGRRVRQRQNGNTVLEYNKT